MELHLFPDTKKALDEIGRVMKKDSRLAVMTFVMRGIFEFEWIRKHLERDHGVHVFDEGTRHTLIAGRLQRLHTCCL